MLKTLAGVAKRVRNFLGFAVFIILSLVALFLWLFSHGSFDPLIVNFARLSREQFFWLVIIVLSMICLILIILIILSYISTRPAPDGRSLYDSKISVVV